MKFICKYLPLFISLVSFGIDQTINLKLEQGYALQQLRNAYIYDLVMPAPANEEERQKRNHIIRVLTQEMLKREKVIQERCDKAYAEKIEDALNDPSCILYTDMYDVDYKYVQNTLHSVEYDNFCALSDEEGNKLQNILKTITAMEDNYAIKEAFQEHRFGMGRERSVECYQQIYNTIEQVHKQLQEANFTYITQEFDFILKELKKHIATDKLLVDTGLTRFENVSVDYIALRVRFFISLCDPWGLWNNIDDARAKKLSNNIYRIVEGANEQDDNDNLAYVNICYRYDLTFNLTNIFIENVIRYRQIEAGLLPTKTYNTLTLKSIND